MSMTKLPLISQIDECPYCGSADGYYYHLTATGHVTQWNHYDGTEADSTEMYEGLNLKARKWCFCTECHNKIGKMGES